MSWCSYKKIYQMAFPNYLGILAFKQVRSAHRRKAWLKIIFPQLSFNDFNAFV